MDNTLLGALIGASATLTAVIIAGLVNYLATQRQENKRLLNQKKEELFYFIQDLINATHDFKFNYLLANNPNEYDKLGQLNVKVKALSSIKVLSSLYFKKHDTLIKTKITEADRFFFTNTSDNHNDINVKQNAAIATLNSIIEEVILEVPAQAPK
jgi:hypothetical protein